MSPPGCACRKLTSQPGQLPPTRDARPELFTKTANLVRKIVEDYYEKLKENVIFPEFEKRKQLTNLTAVLEPQHQPRTLRKALTRPQGLFTTTICSAVTPVCVASGSGSMRGRTPVTGFSTNRARPASRRSASRRRR